MANRVAIAPSDRSDQRRRQRLLGTVSIRSRGDGLRTRCLRKSLVELDLGGRRPSERHPVPPRRCWLCRGRQLRGTSTVRTLDLHSLGGRDVFVIATGADGRVRSAQRFGGSAADEAVAVAAAGGARVIVSGRAPQATDFIGSEGVGFRGDLVFVTSFSIR